MPLATVELLYPTIDVITNESRNYVEQATAHYIVRNAADESAAITSARASIPSAYLGATLKQLKIVERARTTWKVDAEYRRNSNWISGSSLPDETVSFSSDMSTVKRYKSFGSTDYGTNAPDRHGMIETQDGGQTIEGCDINYAVPTMTITHYFTRAEMSDTLRNKIFAAQGKQNNAAFRGFNAGELLLGAVNFASSGEGRDLIWEVSYNFMISFDATLSVKLYPNGTAASEETVSITKNGWSYLWFEYGKESGGALPRFAHVEKVYESANFSDIGLSAN